MLNINWFEITTDVECMHEELINLLSCSDPGSGREWYVRMYVCMW